MTDNPDVGYTPTVQVSDPWTVDKVLAAIPDAPKSDSTSPLAFFHALERLKTTKREGWRRFGIDRLVLPRMNILDGCMDWS